MIKDNIIEKVNNDYLVQKFSADEFCIDLARKNLENKYKDKLEITDKFNRQSVSYQLSKKAKLHSWLKYKEGFSADLVNLLLDEMNIKSGDKILDPFMGSGTTALVCQMRGVDSVGFDILPISSIAIQSKANIYNYNIEELETMYSLIQTLQMPQDYNETLNHLNITEYGYPQLNDRYFRYVSDYIVNSSFSNECKTLFKLCVVNSLEICSYTIKDGQYLGWDSRSPKVQITNKKRVEKGLEPLKIKVVRKEIPEARDIILKELRHIIDEIKLINLDSMDKVCKFRNANINYKESSVLFELPTMEPNSINGVITSPPYCNRYDYTRTYALELAYLGIDDNKLKELRQSLLSCTVENHSKLDKLKAYYTKLNLESRYESILASLNNVEAYVEILDALKNRKEHKDLNNKGVIPMVEGYFTELTFVIAELFRVCKVGSKIAIVNDNVRYGGEVIPVDFLSTAIAEELGFKCDKIYTLKQQKGNSSQQMAKFGRVPLRKSITIWSKE